MIICIVYLIDNMRITAEIGKVGITGVACGVFIVIMISVRGLDWHEVFFKLDRELAILVSAGSAICGAAAILALESSLRFRTIQGYHSSWRCNDFWSI